MNIILGSASPRRKELLEMIGYDFLIDPSKADEDIKNYKNPTDFVRKASVKKAHVVSKNHPDDLIICADTIVVIDNEILGKPHSKEEARKMIEKISGRSHDVLTGVSIYYKNIKKTFSSRTKVYITPLSNEEINNYIETKEPYDKAGAYAIQGIFGKYIEKIQGDYYNVMGLPINKVYNIIKEISKNS